MNHLSTCCQSVCNYPLGEATGSYKHPDNTSAQVTRYTSDNTMSMGHLLQFALADLEPAVSMNV